MIVRKAGTSSKIGVPAFLFYILQRLVNNYPTMKHYTYKRDEQLKVFVLTFTEAPLEGVSFYFPNEFRFQDPDKLEFDYELIDKNVTPERAKEIEEAIQEVVVALVQEMIAKYEDVSHKE